MQPVQVGKSSGQPRTSLIWDMKRRARTRFIYSLRACKSSEDQAKAEAVARKLGTTKYKDLWSSAHSIDRNKVPLLGSTDNTRGDTTVISQIVRKTGMTGIKAWC